MEPIEKVEWKGQVLCLIVRSSLALDQSSFLTSPAASVQVGHGVYPQGHEIPRHVHAPLERRIVGTFEVLLVQKGRLELDVYSPGQEKIYRGELGRGDLMIMFQGGHGFRMMEDTILLEIKQGPYPGKVQEKILF